MDGQILWDEEKFYALKNYGNKPAINVTYYGAWGFCDFYKYKIPNKEEWEKAARGNTGNVYPWGENIDKTRARYGYLNSPFKETSRVGFYNGDAQDGFETKDSPSPYGAYDMAGNVAEWVDDYIDWDHKRVIKGGSFNDNQELLKTYMNGQLAPSAYSVFVGFRCIK